MSDQNRPTRQLAGTDEDRDLLRELGIEVPEPPKITQRVHPDDLIPDLRPGTHKGSVSERYYFWVGVTPECPRSYVTMAGICFPLSNALVIDDPSGGRHQVHVPQHGAIVPVTYSKFVKLKEQLKRTIVRLTSAPAVKNDPAWAPDERGRSVQTVKGSFQRAQRGKLITIKSQEQLAAARAQNAPARPYVQEPGKDFPAAQFLYMMLCADQAHPTRGAYYSTLDKTGLVWPGELLE